MSNPLPHLDAALPDHPSPPFADPDLVADAKAARTRTLIHLRMSQRFLSHLIDYVSSYPEMDEIADEAIRLLLLELNGAGEQLQRFRELRECSGSA